MKTAIVTGASRGVGRKTCLTLAENGYEVFGISRNGAALKSIESENIHVSSVDMTDFNQIKSFAEKLSDRKIDLLVNNAGGGSSPTTIVNEDPNNFNYAYSLNVSGPMYLCKMLTKNLQQSDNPTIIFVSSLGGKFAYVGGGNYTNAKRAVGGLVDTMRLEYPAFGIKITELCPGSIDTVEGETRFYAIKAKDMADTILWIAEMPPHVNINYLELNHIESRKC